MRAKATAARTSVRIAIVIVALVFAGCSTQSPVVAPTGSGTPVDSTSCGKIPGGPPLPPVAIVLTSGQAAYADVASELGRYFEEYTVYDLSDTSRPPVAVLRSINDSNSRAVVAVGLRAAQSSVAMSETPVVFRHCMKKVVT